MSTITIRRADPSEIPAIVALNGLSFGIDSGIPRFLFPNAERRAIDYPKWRMINATAGANDPGRYYMVAVERRERPDGGAPEEEIVAVAEWHAPGGPDPVTPAEERQAKLHERMQRWPESLDREALDTLGKEIEPAMEAALKGAGMHEKANEDMWDLHTLAVSPKHQRKGLGKKLLQWGLDRAAQEGKDVIVIANLDGAPLYRSMGLEELGAAHTFVGRPYAETAPIFIARHKA